MKGLFLRAFAIAALLMIGIAMASLSSLMSSDDINGEPQMIQREDNRPDPLTTKQLELKEKALEARLNGKAWGKTKEVARGQFVELEREGEGKLWTVLGEFADLQHNTMPEPDRAVDNTTIWAPDFSRDYYVDMLFAEGPGAHRAVLQPLRGQW